MAPTTRSMQMKEIAATTATPTSASVSAASSAPSNLKTSNTHSLRKRKAIEVPEEASTSIRNAKKLKVSHQNIAKQKRVAEEQEEEVKAKKPKVTRHMTEKRKRMEEDEDEAQEKEEPVRLVKRTRQAAKSKVAIDKEVQEVPEFPARSAGSTAAPRRIMDKGKGRAASSKRETDNAFFEDYHPMPIHEADDIKHVTATSDGRSTTTTVIGKNCTIRRSMGGETTTESIMKTLEMYAPKKSVKTITSKKSRPLKRTDADITGQASSSCKPSTSNTTNNEPNDDSIPTISTAGVQEEFLQQQGRPSRSKKAQNGFGFDKAEFTDYGNGETSLLVSREDRKIMTDEEKRDRSYIETVNDELLDEYLNTAEGMKTRAMRNWKKGESSSKAPAPRRAITS